ncbi:uncharacterized protein OCT59_010354 [Rhizophagus irregularis]|uniref:uncharacterized protein n=1 Tax=Rhizophagus irregularis TaxID=588596 RepID=UPI003334157C|nr:hypothetical protein OCT59_010354 [Rhizophagus irregularis]
MNQQEEISLIKKQNELILERLNSLDDGTFAALSTNIRRPTTSSTTSPLTCHLYQLVKIFADLLRYPQPSPLTCHLYQFVEILADPLRRPQPSPLT